MRKAAFTLTVVFLTAPAGLQAKGAEIFLSRYTEDSVAFDGDTSDWMQASYAAVSLKGENVVQGKDSWEGEADAAAGISLAYDGKSLFVAATGSDDKHVRTKAFEADEDHLEIWIKIPGPEGDEVKVLAYYPGRKFPTYKGGVRWLDPKTGKSKAVSGAKLYESSEANGWEGEIIVPWKAMPAVWKKLPATRWAVVMVDCDNFHERTRETVLATGWKDDAPKMKLVTVEDIETVEAAFLESVKSKATQLTRQYANVAMDDRDEVILQADTVFGIFGHGFNEGSGFVYVSLPVKSAADILTFELREVTGDDKLDFIFTYIKSGEGWKRTVCAVYAFRGEEVGRVFAQDIERRVGDKYATTKVEVMEAALKGKPMLKVTAGEVKGWTEKTFTLETEVDVQGVITPWMEEKTKYYVYREGGFEKEDTVAVEKYLASPKKAKKAKKKKK
jgi:hypothetical protein